MTHTLTLPKCCSIVAVLYILLSVLGLTPQLLPILLRHFHIDILAFSIGLVRGEFQLSFSSNLIPKYLTSSKMHMNSTCFRQRRAPKNKLLFPTDFVQYHRPVVSTGIGRKQFWNLGLWKVAFYSTYRQLRSEFYNVINKYWVLYPQPGLVLVRICCVGCSIVTIL